MEEKGSSSRPGPGSLLAQAREDEPLLSEEAGRDVCGPVRGTEGNGILAPPAHLPPALLATLHRQGQTPGLGPQLRNPRATAAPCAPALAHAPTSTLRKSLPARTPFPRRPDPRPRDTALTPQLSGRLSPARCPTGCSSPPTWAAPPPAVRAASGPPSSGTRTVVPASTRARPASPQRAAPGARPGLPVLPMSGAAAGGARLGSPRAPAPSCSPAPPGLGPLRCVSFGRGGAEVTEVAAEAGGGRGFWGRGGRGRGGGTRHLWAGRGGGGVFTRPRPCPPHPHCTSIPRPKRQPASTAASRGVFCSFKFIYFSPVRAQQGLEPTTPRSRRKFLRQSQPGAPKAGPARFFAGKEPGSAAPGGA